MTKCCRRVIDLLFPDSSASPPLLVRGAQFLHTLVRGDMDALRKLIRYNRADIAAMGAIFEEAAARLGPRCDLFIERVPFREWSAPAGWRALPAVSSPPPELAEGSPRFADLFGAAADGLRIVGIDLTGSEKRGSGWCFMRGDEASVATLLGANNLRVVPAGGVACRGRRCPCRGSSKRRARRQPR